MGESVFWSEKEDGYGGTFTSELEYHQSNHCFEHASQSINDQESSSKREEDADSCEQLSPLGLTLRKTPSFLSLVQSSLSKGKHAEFDNQSSHHDDKAKPPTKKDDLGSLSIFEKLKASNFCAIFIKIGVWQRTSMHEGDLTAKLYYAKRKLVWELLDGALKSKMEIQWSDIIAIRAITPNDDETGTLEIELNQPPLFYREINPQPRKHTLWQKASDFTGGQATIWRRHYVRFPPGILDKHYEKLLQCDQLLFALSQTPFPSHESSYFDPTISANYPCQPYPSAPRRAPLGLVPNSTVPVPFRHETQTSIECQEPVAVPRGNVNINQVPFNITSAAAAAAGNQVIHSQSISADKVMLQLYGRYINPMLDGTVCWEPPQHFNDTTQIVMEQIPVNNSLTPFMFSHNPTNQHI